MAYDEGLAQRIRESLRDQPDLSEIKMFGGIGFMAQGNMVCGVLNESLIVRVGPERYPEALHDPIPGNSTLRVDPWRAGSRSAWEVMRQTPAWKNGSK